ncbi:MAG: xanthine dehydrogenase family protein molybdopterin-binding subunit [Proteobacteria bacterium]|nr:xanthine dehydrogenase family protein molybdopterin-binding subunit [Pseudomonadota bacterium]
MAELQLGRRAFLAGAAVLTFGLLMPSRRALAAPAPSASFSPSALLRIDADDSVRIIMPHADLGCGSYTGMAQVLADELDADWKHVVAEHLDSLDPAFNHRDWGVIAVGASTSLSSQWRYLREIGATARAMLLAAAAEQWQAPVARLVAANSRVSDPATGAQASFGELTAKAATLAPPTAVKLKERQQFTLIGRGMPRLDRLVKSNGTARFGIDVMLPGMLHAAIAHAPVFGGRLLAVDSRRAEGMAGVRKVVRIPTGVAVIADTYWQARQACDALDIKWDDGAFAKVSSADLWREYAALAATQGTSFQRQGSVRLEEANKRLDGEMRFPFLAHAPMEPLNATARVKDGACEIWCGTQFQGIDVPNIEKATGIPAGKISIHTQWLGGSFGRRASPHADYLIEAVQVAQGAGLDVPVKLTWQREDDIQGGLYRPMALHRYSVGLDARGLPMHWLHKVVCASITKGTFFEASANADGFDRFSVEGLLDNLYAGPNVDYQLHSPSHAVSVCWQRGEADSHNGPAVEGIINRLARLVGADPFEYRRRLLAGKEAAKTARVMGVLDALERESNWKTAPAAKVFRGMAVHASFGSVCGYVVEVVKNGSRLDFQRVTAVFDCGLVINPELVKAQVYSAVAFALSAFLGQQVEIVNGRARQSNFTDYTIAAMRHTPDVDVHLIDSPLDHPTGVGEVGVPPFIPALSEALFQATGQEIDQYPASLRGFTFLEG